LVNEIFLLLILPFFFFIENNEDEEEYHRAKLLNDNSSSNSDTEQIPIASTSTHEAQIENSSNPPHQSNNENEEEQARQVLLEQSDSSEHQDDDTILFRPSICLKRISQAEAECYMPLAWKNSKKKTFLFLNNFFFKCMKFHPVITRKLNVIIMKSPQQVQHLMIMMMILILKFVHENLY
jgi:hypothetical protein